MASFFYAPLVSQFRADSSETGRIRQFLTRLFPSVGNGRPVSRNSAAQRHTGYQPQPDGLAMLEREVNRIRLESRHWLM